MANNFRIGTRDSRLARWQTDYVMNLLKAADPDLSITVVPIKTKGDNLQNIPLENMGVTGIFTKEIENALLDESIDIAVHSLKDLESELPDGLVLAGVPIREDARDVLIAKEHETLETLPAGTQVMTGSLRRKAQLLNLRDDLKVVNIRGNVETRLKKFHNSGPEISGLIMAAAGLKRLDLTDRISSYIPEDVFVPAVGQGALAIEARKGDKKILKRCAKISNRTLETISIAERSFLKTMEGGCLIPVGGFGKIVDGNLELTGMIASIDGKEIVKKTVTSEISDAEITGIRLAEKILEDGGREILDSFSNTTE